MLVELHSKQCVCGGASFMIPPGGAAHCAGPTGDRPIGAISIPAEEWRALGKPRNAEGHEVAMQRARPRVPRTA